MQVVRGKKGEYFGVQSQDPWFSRTLHCLTDMIAKTTEKHGCDWPYLLYAYRTTVQSSMRESQFFLLHGCDSRLPLDEALSQPSTPYTVDIDDFKIELGTGLTDAWKLSGEHVKGSSTQAEDSVWQNVKGVEFERRGMREMTPYHLPCHVLYNIS